MLIQNEEHNSKFIEKHEKHGSRRGYYSFVNIFFFFKYSLSSELNQHQNDFILVPREKCLTKKKELLLIPYYTLWNFLVTLLQDFWVSEISPLFCSIHLLHCF